MDGNWNILKVILYFDLFSFMPYITFSMHACKNVILEKIQEVDCWQCHVIVFWRKCTNNIRTRYSCTNNIRTRYSCFPFAIYNYWNVGDYWLHFEILVIKEISSEITVESETSICIIGDWVYSFFYKNILFIRNTKQSPKLYNFQELFSKNHPEAHIVGLIYF